MGFHIVNLENNQLKHLYVQHEDELIDVEFINEDTIIYQGEKNWFPIRIGDSVKFRNYSKDLGLDSRPKSFSRDMRKVKI